MIKTIWFHFCRQKVWYKLKKHPYKFLNTIDGKIFHGFDPTVPVEGFRLQNRIIQIKEKVDM